MHGNDILSFVRNPALISPSSVHERLYYDFSNRSLQSKLQESYSSPSLLRKVSPSRSTHTKIEDSLYQKQVQSQTKLKRLQAKYEAEEMKEVRKVPKINEMSRLIATQNIEKTSNLKSKYISSILSNSRFIKQTRNAPSQSSIVKSAIIKLEDSESEEPVQDPYYSQLREVMNSRQPAPVVEDPPSLLEMSVVERGKHWISQRIQKLQKLKEQLSEKTLQKCTFAPVITPRACSNLRSTRARSVCNSYSELYQLKKNRVQSPGRLGPNFFEKSKGLDRSNDKIKLLRQLSPAQQKIGFSAGGDFDRIIGYSKIKNS